MSKYHLAYRSLFIQFAEMNKPALNQTFDTSLIDLSARLADPQDVTTSFSTTESDPSTTDHAATMAVEPSNHSRAIDEVKRTVSGKGTRYLQTTTAYNEWASTYDTDGNILQAIDDLELEELLPFLLRLVPPPSSLDPARQCLNVVDLGCGTGRNLIKLSKSSVWAVQHPISLSREEPLDIKVTGLDGSQAMLDVAQRKIDNLRPANAELHVQFSYQLHVYDLLAPTTTLHPVVASNPDRFPADAIISTLVLEHIPLRPFFSHLCCLIDHERVGYVLLTNMHPEMGARSQAGFETIDAETGDIVKVRPKSYNHEVRDILNVAQEAGFELVGEIREIEVTQRMIDEGKVSKRGEKWVGTKVWLGMTLKWRAR